jgi:hypothetical protein
MKSQMGEHPHSVPWARRSATAFPRRATNNPDLEAEGQLEKIGGKFQKKIGQVEKVLGK